MTHWVIADCDEEILNYYRWWVHKKTSVWVNKPKDGAHISIVRGDIETGTWNRTPHGEWSETIEFQYKHDLELQYNYVWLRVYSERLHKIREEVGLSYQPKLPFHMTIGNVRDDLVPVLERAFL